MGKRATRFFIGIHEIGDFTLRLSQGLRYWGFQVTNVVSELRSPLLVRESTHDRYINESGSKYVRQLRYLGEFTNQILRNDLFVFSFSLSFTGYLQQSPSHLLRHLAYSDLSLLRTLGKKIVIIVNGDDLRSRRLLVEDMKRGGLGQHALYASADLDLDFGGPDEMKREKAAKIERYADHIFARPNCAQFLTRHYHLLWLPVDLSTFRFSVENTGSPLIVHAPSNSSVKGTKYIVQALNRLGQDGYKFEFELCQNIQNVDLRKMLSNAQIAIDQLILPGYGLFAIEAMASGCAVLGSAVPGYNGNPTDLPIMTTTPDTIYQNLRSMLEDRQLRLKMAKEGRTYVEMYHDHIKVAHDFLRRIGEI